VSFPWHFLSFLGEPPTIRKLKFLPSSFRIQGQSAASFSARGTGAGNPRSSNLLGALSSNHYLTNLDFGTAHNGNAIGSGFVLAGGVTGTDFFLVE
jgi:hypothetical protein